MTSVLPFLGYVSKRQHGITLNGICSRFEDTLLLCVCTTPAPNFCLLQRFVLIYLFHPGRSFNFRWPKAWVIQVALSVTVCPRDEAMCAVVRAHRISLPAEFSLFCCTFLVGTPWWRILWKKKCCRWEEMQCLCITRLILPSFLFCGTHEGSWMNLSALACCLCVPGKSSICVSKVCAHAGITCFARLHGH